MDDWLPGVKEGVEWEENGCDYKMDPCSDRHVLHLNCIVNILMVIL